MTTEVCEHDWDVVSFEYSPDLEYVEVRERCLRCDTREIWTGRRRPGDPIPGGGYDD